MPASRRTVCHPLVGKGLRHTVTRHFYIVSLGCPKSVVDAEGIGQVLRVQGYERADRPENADVLIVNTCGFIASAREESIAALRDLAAHKRRGQILIAAGCLPERDDVALNVAVPRLDGAIGTRHWTEIAALLEQLRAHGRQRADYIHWRAAHPEVTSLVASLPRIAAPGASAYVKIADGCDAPCAFCTIPSIKGPRVSKPVAQVIREAQELVAQGVKELILIAQDTTAYGRDLGQQDGLPDLIEGILTAVPDLPWLRLLYSYPQHITSRLVDVMAAREQLCHYLDMPLQHSHPQVLRRMRRAPDIAGVRRLIATLRQRIPDIALRTTFIVGYPGETEQEFAHLLDFMREIAFDKVGVFTYSREAGTPAATLPDQVPDELKEERFRRAMELQQGISLARNKAQVGRTLPVLIEGQGDGISVGRSYRDAPVIDGMVIIPGAVPPGEIVPAQIVQGLEYDLVGELAM